MQLKYLLADAMKHGNTKAVLTAVGDALTEVMESNNCSSILTTVEANKLNEPLREAATLVYQAKNIFNY